MQIILHNTLPIQYNYFTKRIESNKLLPRYLEWAESKQGVISLLRNAKGRYGFQDFDILSAVRSDGIDILEAQQQYGLFNPTRSLEATKWSFDESERQQLGDRILKTLEAISKAIPSDLLPERLIVVILPADCANGSLILNCAGISSYGREPGYLFLRIWPSAGNLNRLDYILARSFIHGIRRRAQNKVSPISLGEACVMEGLAATFIHNVFPEVELPGLVCFMPPDDWREALAEIAGYYGKTSYDDVPINIYGTQILAGSFRPPEVAPLTQEELKYAAELITAQSDCMEANVIAAYLYGDMFIAAQGHPAFGIPHLAGFEVGYHLVKRYINTTGIDIASALSPNEMISNKNLSLSANAHLEPCIGCGAQFPPYDGPVHRYMTSSPGCWAAYGEILQRFYGNVTAADAHRISVDAYAIQHPGSPNPQAIQSVTGHLVNLCLIFEYKVSDPAWRRGMIQSITRYSRQFVWLDPPEQNGLITVADLLPLSDVHALHQRSVEWARSIWDAWHVHHPMIRHWAAKIIEG